MDCDKDKREPQQRTEDADKQTEKQEREYRKEKAGTYKKPDEKDQSDQNTTEKYLNIKKKNQIKLQQKLVKVDYFHFIGNNPP